eukprot:CAMPEP_0114548554 /NCGR_PEP_ID=MMETSP0114-20121206/5046_1 /TAXON_ID=31324 /ORGANISM="Goniomonas sp, Strain m" /LENGTH=60 /DNA_ID=CAMNT_0001733157 /DNA_START=17 /DNA_END=199 /DNA_ORIENTATION=+
MPMYLVDVPSSMMASWTAWNRKSPNWLPNSGPFFTDPKTLPSYNETFTGWNRTSPNWTPQ